MNMPAQHREEDPQVRQLRYGGIVVRRAPVTGQLQVLLREVAGHYKGYVWTWPKGGAEEGETPEAAAVREVLEETGWVCAIEGPLSAEFVGLETVTRFWFMRAVRDTAQPGVETAQVRWVSMLEAERLLSLTTHEVGRARDLAILGAVKAAAIEARAARTDAASSTALVLMHEREGAGHALGG